MTTSELSHVRWVKSSRSRHESARPGSCVEVADLTSAVAVRDSKLSTIGDFPHLTVTPDDWTGLLTEIHSGALTH